MDRIESDRIMPKLKTGVLICSAGRRVGLLEAFRAAGEWLGLELRIVACDLDPRMSAACALADAAHPVPRATEPGYAEAVLDIVEHEEIDLVVPTIDPELLPLSLAVGKIAVAGASVHVSPPEVIEIVRDKGRTAHVLGAAGVPVPATRDEITVREDPDGLRWPVIGKPSGGSASRGIALFERVADIPECFDEPMIFQDRLEGPEYTINLFVDENSQLQAVVPHRRLQIRAGEVEKGRTERRDDLHAIAEGVVCALPALRGVACFQVIDDAVQGPRVFEINARFGGGYPIADRAGAPFARWLLEETAGLRRTAGNDWRVGVEMLRYDAAFFRG